MTDLEILAELKKAYDLLNDIRENACGCTEQLNKDQETSLENAIREMAKTYYRFYQTLNKKDLYVDEYDNDTIILISQYINAAYDIYDKDYNYTGEYVGDLDMDYQWWEDYDFITKECD